MAQTAAIVVAAGRGSRAGGGLPKQYRAIAGQPVLQASLSALARHGEINAIQPVIHRDDIALFARLPLGPAVLPPVHGGATRQASVLAGLEALAAVRPALVLVHDAARPFASPALISRAVAAATQSGAAVPALAVTDTVKEVDDAGRVVGTRARDTLRLVQTPQAFTFEALLAAHRRAADAGRDDFSDDAALMEWAGHAVTTFEGEAGNIKITSEDDFVRAEAIRMAALGDVRIGSGVDVHAFAPGDHVTLGGVRIAHSQALSGHSDADVVLHAIVDAILGALADGDIGVHFPPSDPQWRGASSDRFVVFAMERLKARGGIVAHIDVNIVCEAPRIGPHRDAMRVNIAALTGIDASRVGIKATTSEKMGFTGRGEGIAAFATVTVRLPWETS
ncbi:MAG: bifunctional 2-C-methyl-D-erythritol 4-phosphate cytidylyltransferase/2-C-methyl-D-erythritol 2,4-cyclodiphosphate synthase [Pseudolabrys sp.]